jgi:Ca-activated chloride channel family protein
VDAPTDLAFDAQRADALVTVRARSAGPPGARPPAAEVLIMDRSLSMAGRRKLDEAKRAVCAAIDALPDGTLLGVVAGHHEAQVVYPPHGGLAPVDAAAREAAKRHVRSQLPEGGTAIGTWLARADRLFASVSSPAVVRHAVLYTDGRNEHETPEQLGEVLAACADRFVCDVRGLGEDWDHAELLRITEALHGTARAVLDIADLTEDFTGLVRQAQHLVVPRVYLGLRLNERFHPAFVRQTRPVEAGLTHHQVHQGEIHVPLGAWSPETRQYQVSLRFDPETLAVDERQRAARITLHAERPDGTRRPCSQTKTMVVVRRATPGYGIPRSAGLTRVENERELGMAMRACADARQRGDLERADRELRLALRLAENLGDTVRLGLLRAVAATGPDGLPQVRRDASRGELQRLGLESTRTGAPPVDALVTGLPPGAGTDRRRCRRCGATAPVTAARYCEACGHPLDDAVDGAPEDAS